RIRTTTIILADALTPVSATVMLNSSCLRRDFRRLCTTGVCSFPDSPVRPSQRGHCNDTNAIVATNARRMNILYIHSHDTGRWIQPYGFPVATPNLQKLAENGVLFRQAFCVSPTCSPSRAALLTGKYPHNNGMLGLAHRGFGF